LAALAGATSEDLRISARATSGAKLIADSFAMPAG
jgi:hypothetical protein